jgi:cytochrome c biogenesis protein CcmG/thiol:disulfide interchange protein DsbE
MRRCRRRNRRRARIPLLMLMRLRREGVTIHGLDWKDEPEAGNGVLQNPGDPYARVGNDRSGRTGIESSGGGVAEPM